MNITKSEKFKSVDDKTKVSMIRNKIELKKKQRTKKYTCTHELTMLSTEHKANNIYILIYLYFDMRALHVHV